MNDLNLIISSASRLWLQPCRSYNVGALQEGTHQLPALIANQQVMEKVRAVDMFYKRLLVSQGLQIELNFLRDNEL